MLTIGIVWLSAFLGDTCSYVLGDRLGRDWVVKHGPRLRITPERFKQVEEYFSRHGGKTILIGRFIGLVRALAPVHRRQLRDAVPAAGALQHPRHRHVGDAVHAARLLRLEEHRRGPEQLRARAARLRGDRRADRRRDRRLPVAQRCREPRPAGRRDGEAAGAPQPARARPPAQPAGALPAQPADPGRARPRVHDGARARSRSAATSDRLRARRRRPPGPTTGRLDRRRLRRADQRRGG